MGETCIIYGREKFISSMEILKESDGSLELGLNGCIIIQETSNKSE